MLYAEDTGRWCLQQRSTSVSDPGVWSTWGGGREPGETLEQTVRRELAEEGGYTGPLRLEPLMMGQRYATYIGHVPHEFEPRLNSESQDSRWVEAGSWPSPLHPGLQQALTKLNEGADRSNPTPGSKLVKAVMSTVPQAQEIWFHGSRATGKHRPDSDTDILVVVPDSIVGEHYLNVVQTLQKLSHQFNNFDIQPTRSGNNIHRIAQQEGKLLWSKNQGVAEADNQSSAKTGIYQTDVFGAKAYHAKCMEPNCDWESKRFDRIKQAQAAAEKHAKSHFKQGVAEGLLAEETLDDYLASLKSSGAKLLGRGNNAMVFTNPEDDRTVIKVMHQPDPAYLAYLRQSIKHPNNPWLPRVLDVTSQAFDTANPRSSTTAWIIVLEKLRPASAAEVKNAVDTVLATVDPRYLGRRPVDAYRTFDDIKKLWPIIAQHSSDADIRVFAEFLSQFAPQDIDVSNANVMMRGPQLVFADPVLS